MKRSFKKVVSVLLVLIISFSVLPLQTISAYDTEGKIIYFVPNENWKKDNAKFAAYLYNDIMSYEWVEGKQVCEEDIYEFVIPEGYEYLIFCRMSPNATELSWNYKWNQTSDIPIPTDGQYNCYTLKHGVWDGSGQWEYYDGFCSCSKTIVSITSPQSSQNLSDREYSREEEFEIYVLWDSRKPLVSGMINTYLDNNGLQVIDEEVNPALKSCSSNISDEIQKEFGMVTLNFSYYKGIPWSGLDYIVKYRVRVLGLLFHPAEIKVDFIEAQGKMNQDDENEIDFISDGTIVEENKNLFSFSLQVNDSVQEDDIEGNDTEVSLIGSFNQWENITMLPDTKDADVYSVTITVEKGIYEFGVFEKGTLMGNNDGFTDTISNYIFSSEKGKCGFICSGGIYKFKYNIQSNKLTVRRLEGPNKKVNLSGTFNIWAFNDEKSFMTEESTDIFTKTMELEAGEYQFKIIEDGVWLGNDWHFNNTTQPYANEGIIMQEELGNCFLIADGGIYTFIYNAITNKLTVLWNREDSALPSTASSSSDKTEPTESSSTQQQSSSGETDPTENSSSQQQPSSGETEPTEHSWGNEKVELPSCEETGKVEYTCIHCGEIKTEIIRERGHNFSSEYTIDKKETCTEKGSKSRHCLNCDEVTDVKEIQIDKNAHTIVKDKGVSPSCSQSGITEGSHCAECNKVIVAQKKIKKTTHKNIEEMISYFKYGYEYKTICKDCNSVISQGIVSDKSKIIAPKFTVKGGKNKITVKYEKVSGANGYQIKYVKGNTEITETCKSVKKVIKNIKKGSYKVYVRAFVKYGGNRYYSNWKKAKKVKVK